MINFSIEKNRITGDYEVVCHRGKRAIVVAANLRTRDHASAALRFWCNMTNADSSEDTFIAEMGDEIERLRIALEWYACSRNQALGGWDGGARARAALNQEERCPRCGSSGDTYKVCSGCGTPVLAQNRGEEA